MKRFRWKGYYNEQTDTIEMGSYASLVKLLSKDFRGIKDRIKQRKEDGSIDISGMEKAVYRVLRENPNANVILKSVNAGVQSLCGRAEWQ